MNKRIGRHTVKIEKPVYIISAASYAGKKEGEGPLGKYFDFVAKDIMLGEKSWEKAESMFFKKAFETALQKAEKNFDDIDYLLAGDLLNQ